MELSCTQCSAKFRVALRGPLTQAVRVICPSCRTQMVVRPPVASTPEPARQSRRRAVIADEPREFRNFLGEELRKMGFEVSFHETGETALYQVRDERAELVVLNVYLKGKLGVEICEEIKADPALSRTKVVLIGALFRANRFRANPTNLYGADEYIEEQIPARELQRIVKKLFPDLAAAAPAQEDSRDHEEARRLARLILSDIVIYNSEKVERGIRDGSFFELLRTEIDDGRAYYESRVAFKVRQNSEIFDETLHQFVEMKREELGKAKPGEP
jgi:DNA-binding response OmpR family regulator